MIITYDDQMIQTYTEDGRKIMFSVASIEFIISEEYYSGTKTKICFKSGNIVLLRDLYADFTYKYATMMRAIDNKLEKG